MVKITEYQQIKIEEIIYKISKRDNFNLLHYYINKIVYSTNNLSFILNKIEATINDNHSDLELLLNFKKIYDEICDRILDELCAFYNDEN